MFYAGVCSYQQDDQIHLKRGKKSQGIDYAIFRGGEFLSITAVEAQKFVCFAMTQAVVLEGRGIHLNS